MAHPLCPAGHLPHKGEIGKTLFRQFILSVEMGETVPQVDLPHCGGDVRQDRGGSPTPKRQLYLTRSSSTRLAAETIASSEAPTIFVFTPAPNNFPPGCSIST